MEEWEGGDMGVGSLNGPQNTVISGARDEVTALMGRFDRLGIRCQLLTVSHAFHSPLMRSAVAEFGRIAAGVQGQTPKIAWISTVSAAPMREPPGAGYWCDHALNAVRFVEAIQPLDQPAPSASLQSRPANR